MAWTTPMTFSAGAVLTAAQLNTHLRDNMNETAAATASSAGDLVYADAANSMGSRLAHPGQSRMLVSDASNGLAWRQPAEDVNFSGGSASGASSATSYTEAWLAGEDLPSVTVTTGTRAIVVVSVYHARNDTAGSTISISSSVSGATTTAATDNAGALFESGNANDNGSLERAKLFVLTAGSNTFQMEAKVSGGTGTIIRPNILVIPL